MTLIAEDLLLLLLDDDSGALPVLWTDIEVPLGAALLDELRIGGAVTADPASVDDAPVLPAMPLAIPSPLVTVVGDPAPTDPLLAEALAVVRAEPRPADLLAAVLGDGMLERLTDRLVDAGVLERDESRLLGIVPRTRWPALKTTGEAAVRDALRAALVEGAPADPRTAAIAALLAALDRMPRTLGLHGADAQAARDRAEALLREDWAARTVRDAVAQAATAASSPGLRPGSPLAL